MKTCVTTASTGANASSKRPSSTTYQPWAPTGRATPTSRARPAPQKRRETAPSAAPRGAELPERDARGRRVSPGAEAPASTRPPGSTRSRWTLSSGRDSSRAGASSAASSGVGSPVSGPRRSSQLRTWAVACFRCAAYSRSVCAET